MRKGSTVTVLIFVTLASLSALFAHAEVRPGEKIKAFVSILPMSYFVERVGGPNVEVNVLVGPGQDPHTFDPTPKLITKLAKARVLFKMGFSFEDTLIEKVGSTFKNTEVVDLQQGIKLRPMTEAEARTGKSGHVHGESKHEHSHKTGEMDPHTWLDPQLAKIQAKTIADTLIRIDPTHRLEYEKNLTSFQDDLDAVDKQLKEVLDPFRGKSFYVFHPAYGYFGDAYGLKQVAVQIGGKDPTAKQLAKLMSSAKKEGVKIIFVQPQFSKKGAEVLAKAIGGAVVPLDDLSANYLDNLRDMALKLRSAL
jgi:zinc transport system substrate-binding protein